MGKSHVLPLKMDENCVFVRTKVERFCHDLQCFTTDHDDFTGEHEGLDPTKNLAASPWKMEV